MECQKCANCCTLHPCPLLPEDVKPIAQFLGIDVPTLFKEYLVIDWWAGDNPLYYLCPTRVGAEKGTIASWGFTFTKGVCVFLTPDKLCRIHQVKPHGGRTYICNSGLSNNKLWYAKKWKHHIQPFLDMAEEKKESRYA